MIRKLFTRFRNIFHEVYFEMISAFLRQRCDTQFEIFHDPGIRNNYLRGGLRKRRNTCIFLLSCLPYSLSPRSLPLRRMPKCRFSGMSHQRPKVTPQALFEFFFINHGEHGGHGVFNFFFHIDRIPLFTGIKNPLVLWR
jgi:hypothetical protein